MNFTNMKISSRLAVAFGIILAISIATAFIAVSKLSNIHDSLLDIVQDNNVKIRLSNDMSDAVHIVSRVTRTMVLLQDKESRDREMGKIIKARETYDKSLAELGKMPNDAAEIAGIEKISAARSIARPLNDKVLELGTNGKETEATVLLMKEAAPATQKWQDAIDESMDNEAVNSTKQFENTESQYQHARNILIAANILCVAVAALLGWLVTRSITSQLGGEPGEASLLAQGVAEGDLTRQVNLKNGDTLSMMANLGIMQRTLVRIVTNVRQGSESVATASSQIAQGTNDLSSRTEEQASALEQTAASMEQLNATVKQNSDSARQANQLAMNASSVAIKGGEVVTQVVDTMKGINESSRRIADIIQVIDGIAFQTNILALNAAVEAARAGEQGRGFAVVATEVRSLAGRSAEAAKEIKTLISASVERVEQGTALVDQAGATMTEVVTAIRRVADLMGEISSASAEQSAGVAQVGEAVVQMDQVTQQNAALVEEMAAAAGSLSAQAQDLVKAVGVFNLGTGHQRATPQVARISPGPPMIQGVTRKIGGSGATGAMLKPKTASIGVPAPVAKAQGVNDDWESF